MATSTFTSAGVNNLASNAANWDTPPADTRGWAIPAGQTCEMDIDTSGYATGIDGITITGTLKLSRSTSGYIKMKAATTIAGAGAFDCGASAGDAIPFAVKHTITGGAGWYITGASGLTMTVYAAEPSIKTILTTALEPIGETAIAVATDITSDIWADGDTIRIDDITGAAESEERVIAAGGRAAGVITITAGLTAAKSAGSVMHLITRNVKFVGAANNWMVGFLDGKITIAGGQWGGGAYNMFTTANQSLIISGGTFSGATTLCNANLYGNRISGGIFSGNGTAFSGCNGMSITGGTFTGHSTAVISGGVGVSVNGATFYGNTYGLASVIGFSLLGNTFIGNQTCVGTSSGIIKNTTMQTSSSRDVYLSVITAFNTLFGSTNELTAYTSFAQETYAESLDHDQTAGKFAAWTKGGVTLSNTVTVPAGYTTSYQITLESASYIGFWRREVTVGAGASVNITMNLYKSGAMTYLPRCIIFNKAATDPFAGGAGIHTFTMTDSTTTWEDELYTYTNATANDVTLVIRFQGKNASGTVATALLVEQINVDLTSAIALLNTIATDTTTDIPALIADLPTAVENRQEMDSNSTQLSAILLDTGTTLDTDIQSVLSNQVVINGTVDAILEDTGTTLDALVKDIPTNAELATALGTADDAVLTAIGGLNNAPNVSSDVTAIKTITDQFAFTVANQVDANVLTGGGGATAEDVRIEMDANSTKLATIATDTTTDIPALINALDTDSVLSAAVEGVYTVQDVFKLVASVLAGKASGGGGDTITFRDLSDALDRVTATVDSNGNRTGVTLDLT